jgi:EAL domain-containing protein (putative c-di-GMP-specific phosphodiesterase class I)/ActR/RegA family two-component response regulator
MSTAPAAADGTAVLVVDDEPGLVAALSAALRAAGLDVLAAANADEALVWVETGRVGAVVTDIAMPGQDGIALLCEIRKRDLDLPVVLMTGAPDLQTAIAAVEYGALRYMTKPFETRALIEQVRTALRWYRLARTKREAMTWLGTQTGEASDRAGLEAAFARALESLWIAYQPIVRAADGSLFGYEALLRAEDRTLPHPGAILDAATRLGRLSDLSAAIHRRVIEDLQCADPSWTIFVNLHPDDLRDPAIVGPDAQPFAGVRQRLVLEVTERAAMDSIPDLRSTIARLRGQGHRIAIDDLGAGYAGLSSFLLLQPDVVKLDMSLTRGCDGDDVRRKLVRSMTSLCHEIGLEVVAEGVETDAERECLVALGCDLLQGFLIAKPERPFTQPCG